MNRTVKEFFRFPFSYPARNPLLWIVLQPAVAFMGATAGSSSLPPVFYVSLATLTYPAAFIVYGLNDLYDVETDAYNDREVVKDTVISRDDYAIVWGWAAIFTLICALPVVWSGKISTMLVGLLALFSAVAYSVPPLRLKTKPVLSLVTMSVGGWALYAFGYSFTGSISTISARSFFYGLLSHMAVSLGAIPDMEADKKAGDTTFPLVYGKTAAVSLALTSVIATILSGTVTGPVLWFLFIAGGGLLSMLFFERYLAHFRVIMYAGFVILAYLIWRGLTGFIAV